MTNGSTNQSISNITNIETSISTPQFWFGVLLISFPTILYSFSLITYLSVLYDSRLAEAIRLLTSDKTLKDRFVNVHLDKFHLSKTKKDSKNTLFKSLPSVRDPIFMPQSIFSNQDHQNNLKRAYSIKSQIMTELIQRLAMKMDGSTITGYLFPVMLLQLVVASAFVVPSLEFARLGIIGIDVFSDICQGDKDAYTCNLINFWPISWGIIGAFVHSFISLMDRIPRKDVNPRYFLNVAMRYIFAIALSAVFFLISSQTYDALTGAFTEDNTSDTSNSRFSMGMIAAISFFIGMFPNRYFRIMDSNLGGKFKRNHVKDIPLESFSGINVNEATRLWEEGIDNVDQLADCSVQDLYKKTKFSPIRLKGLIGRALLWKYLFGNDNMLVAWIIKTHNWL